MLKIKALESSFNSFFFFYFVCIPSATPTDFASKIHLESADFSPFATCSKPSSAPLCTITIASLLVGLSRMLISFSLFSTQEPKCSFLKHRSDLVTPLHMILHGFPISEYKLKSLERLPTPCMNRFSHFLISSPNILSLNTLLHLPRLPCWSKSSHACTHSGPVHSLSFLLKQSSTCYLQSSLDLSKSLLKYHHIKRPNVVFLPCLLSFFSWSILPYLYPHTYICLFSICHLLTSSNWLQSLFLLFIYHSCFIALFHPSCLEQYGIWPSFNKYFWMNEQVALEESSWMEFCC